MTATTSARRNALLQDLSREGTVSVEVAARRYQVSRVTIRADLNEMAGRGLLTRTRGGAQALPRHEGAGFVERIGQATDSKKAIAQRAAAEIVAGEVVILDGGTTTLEIARSIDPELELTVITPSIDVATVLADRPRVSLQVIGGALDRRERTTIGPIATRIVREFIAHRAFLGANAIDEHFDIVDTSLDIAALKRAIIDSSRETVLVADSTKWGGRATAKAAPLTAITRVITDSKLPEMWRRYLRGHGVELAIASAIHPEGI